MKKNDQVMGDKIIISHSAVGAVGRGAVNYGNITHTSENFNFDAMADELGKLKDALYALPQSEAQIIALSDVIRAEEAVSVKDSSALVKSLKKLGPWVLDVARDIGVNVIASFMGK